MDLDERWTQDNGRDRCSTGVLPFEHYARNGMLHQEAAPTIGIADAELGAGNDTNASMDPVPSAIAVDHEDASDGPEDTTGWTYRTASWSELARRFLEDRSNDGDLPNIRYWRHAFCSHQSTDWGRVDEESVKLALYQFAEEQGIQASRSVASELLFALKAHSRIDDTVQPPCVLDGGKSIGSRRLLAFKTVNAAWDLDDLHSEAAFQVLEPSASHFVFGARGFDYDRNAACPKWEKFLQSSLPDEDARLLLQQFFGYVVSGETDRQKFLVLMGAPRSGKSIIARTLSHLVGNEATATSSLSSLGGEFGLSALLGKELLLIPDAQASGNCHRAVERIKTIVGEDHVDVNVKNRPILTDVCLKSRVVITCNQLPRFLDPSGALHKRLLLINFEKSFAGIEDLALERRLTQELPGIFNWACAGRPALCSRGFVMPKSSEDALKLAEDSVTPMKVLLEDRCRIGDDEKVCTDELWAAYREWCSQDGYRPGNKAEMGSNLRAVLPAVGRKQLRDCGKRVYFYTGISLNCLESFARKRGNEDRTPLVSAKKSA